MPATAMTTATTMGITTAAIVMRTPTLSRFTEPFVHVHRGALTCMPLLMQAEASRHASHSHDHSHDHRHDHGGHSHAHDHAHDHSEHSHEEGHSRAHAGHNHEHKDGHDHAGHDHAGHDHHHDDHINSLSLVVDGDLHLEAVSHSSLRWTGLKSVSHEICISSQIHLYRWFSL